MSERKHVRLFRNGRNQAVRIPVEFELPGNEAIMHCDGDRLVIEAVRKRGLIALLKSMTAVDEDFLRERQADRLVARDHVCACVGFAGGAAASGRG